MMCYRDGRFGRHPRWRFFVFNVLMRRKASSAARYYVSKNSGMKNMTREELGEALHADEQLLPQIVRQGSKLPGTRPFWRNKSYALQAQARFLSRDEAPVFLTFSCADMQWEDLQRHLPQYDVYRTATEQVRKKIVWENVQAHPHIIAAYLDLRFKAFAKHVLRPLFGFQDFWHRSEWQARGTGHYHCLFWIPSAPALDVTTQELRDYFALYWGVRITAVNPDPLRRPDARHPASLHHTDVANTADQFTAFVNRFQKHRICSKPQCLRATKDSNTLYCRFHFPRPLFGEAVVTKEIDHKSWRFSPARNDAYMNQCIPAITYGWMANTDAQPPASMHALLKYIAKYASKPEKKSASYTELQNQILPHTSNAAPALSFVSKMLNKLIGERDWSAQEVSHILLGIPMQDASRVTVTLDCRESHAQDDMIVLEDGTVKAGRSAAQRYQARMADSRGQADLRALTLFDWLQHWNWDTFNRRPRALPRVINYFPRYSKDPSAQTYADYCRVKLMLHHPFNTSADLLAFDGLVFKSYADAYSACMRLHTMPHHPLHHTTLCISEA